MADIKLSALPAAATTPASSDILVGLQAGVASQFTLAQVVGITLPANSTPLDTDQLMCRQLASPNSAKTLTLARVRNQVVNGAGAAATLALADTLLGAQASVGVVATVQQVLDAYGLVATDTVPADTDLVAVNQGAVGKKLAVSALRTQLDLGVAGGRTINGGTAASENLTLAATSHATPGSVKIPAQGSVAKPSLVIGSTTAGLFEEAGVGLALVSGSSGYIRFYSGGSARWHVANSSFAFANSGGASGQVLLSAAAASSTVPVYTFASNTTSGLGLGATDSPSLIAAGNEILRADFVGSVKRLGFLGKAATPAAAQTGGAATAGGVYTAAEQAMLQAAYDCLRTFGLLT